MTLRPSTLELGMRDRVPPVIRQFARDYHLSFVGAVFAVHWVLVTLAGALATQYATSNPTVKALGWSLPNLTGIGRLTVQPMRNWDGFWYSLIAEHGYIHEATTAFWPLYPWTMRIAADLFAIPVEVAGYLLSNIAFFLALAVLYRFVASQWGQDVARRCILLLAFFPTAFFFSAVYSESFFLLFGVLAFSWARSGEWWRAGLAALLAGLTRNVGVLLAIPLGIMFLRQYGPTLQAQWRRPLAWPRHVLALGLIPLGPAIFVLYLWNTFNNPLMTIEAQKGWARIQAMPWTTFQMAFDQWEDGWLHALMASPTWATLTSYSVRLSFAEYESLDILMAIVGIALIIYAWRVLPLEYSTWVTILFVLPLFSPSTVHPLMSVPRFLLVLFPLFIALALLLRRRAAFLAVLIPSAAFMALLVVQFSTWFWVS